MNAAIGAVSAGQVCCHDGGMVAVVFFSMVAGGLILLHYCRKVLFKASVVEFEGNKQSKSPKSPTAAFGCLVVWDEGLIVA